MTGNDAAYTPLTYRIAFASLQGMGVDLARKLMDVVGDEQRFFTMRRKNCAPSRVAAARSTATSTAKSACNGL